MTGTPAPDPTTTRAAYPVGPRVLAALGALIVAAWFGVLVPLSYAGQGFVWTPIALVAATLPLVVFLGLLAASPDALQRILTRFTALNLRDGGHVAAAVLMAVALYLVLGLGAVFNGVATVETVLTQEGGEELLTDIDGETLFAGLIQNLILLTLPPFFYVAFVHGGGPLAALRRLGLHTDNLGTAVVVGVLSTVLIFLAIIGINLAAHAAGVEADQNERALAIAKAITVLGAVGLSLGAAIGEEVFFRGFLQPRIGLIGQAVVFGIAHLSYVNVTEVIVTTVLALLFGIMYRRTGNLAAPMIAHFLFNLVMLVAGIYYEPPAPAA